MLRLHLPPNLVAAAARDAVAVRVELDLSTAPAAELLPLLALLQRWCGPQPPGVLQLNRRQLGELSRAAAGQRLFVEGGTAVAWRHDDLLREPAVTAAPAASLRGTRGKAGEDARPLEVDGSEHYLALTLPSREHPQYAEALALVKEAGFLLEPSNGRWWLRDRHRTLSFLARHGERLRGALAARFTPAFTRQTAHLVPARLAAHVETTGNQFSVELGLAAEGASEAEALEAAPASVEVTVDCPEETTTLGGRVTLLLKIRNTGTAPVSSVTPVVHFGAGLEPLGIRGRNGHFSADGSVMFDRLAELPAGGCVELEIVAVCTGTGTIPYRGAAWCGDGEDREIVPADDSVTVTPSAMAAEPTSVRQR